MLYVLMRRRGAIVLCLLSAPLLAGCMDGPEGNLLQNPGFEAEAEHWFFLEDRDDWVGFDVLDAPVRSGTYAARTEIADASAAGHSRVAGAIQELAGSDLGDRLPERLRGAYRIEAWESELPRTYVQVVVGLFPQEDANEPVCPGLAPTTPCQLAYLLAGIDERPLPLANRQYVLAGPVLPTLGEWVTFDLPFREDFLASWAHEPGAVGHAWFYVEARYDADDTEAGGGPVRLAVVWDDLYFGTP